MKKYILFLMSIIICASTMNIASAKSTTSSSALASAIRLYKSGNYVQSYSAFSDIVKKDPSNAVAYYYLAMTSAQVGKKEEAISNYEKVISLSSVNSQLSRYSRKGKRCLENPEKCQEPDENEDDLDRFIRQRFGTGFSEDARSDYENQKIQNLRREINRNEDVDPQKFRDYKDFSSEVPTNDEIVHALRVLQKAGLGSMAGAGYGNEMSLFMGTSNGTNDVMNMLTTGGKNNLSPQVIQALLTNQMSTGF